MVALVEVEVLAIRVICVFYLCQFVELVRSLVKIFVYLLTDTRSQKQCMVTTSCLDSMELRYYYSHFTTLCPGLPG